MALGMLPQSYNGGTLLSAARPRESGDPDLWIAAPGFPP